MPLAVHVHAHPENFSPLPTFILVLVAFVYLRGWLRLRSASPALFPAWRLAAFTSGLVSIWIALCSPLAALDHQLLTIHMLKHLLLMAAGPPLILLGTPALPFVCGLPKYFMRRVLLRGRTRPLLGRFLSNSVFCWLAGAAAVLAWHVPALFQVALTSHMWHIVEDTSFLCGGLLFWRPIVRPWSSDAKPLRWSMPLYLFLATLPCDILSAFLTFCGRVVYPSYVSTARIFTVSPLQDQESAGALMWICVTFAYLIPAVVITMKLLSPGSVHREAQSAFYEFPAHKVSGSEAEADRATVPGVGS
jgi:cytochrome c oxidase assembly factor CtaG